MLLTLVVTSLLQVTDAPPAWDAWLENPQVRPLTDGRSPQDLALLARSHVTSVESRRGVPHFLWAERVPFDATGLTASEAARRHLLRFARLYRLDAETVSRLVVSEVHQPGNGGAVIVGFAREQGGVPYLRDELDVVMTAQLQLVALTGSLATERPRADTFPLDASSAISVAAQVLFGTLVSPSAFPLVKQRPGGWARFEAAGTFHSSPRARKVFFDTGSGVLPAWHLEVEAGDELTALVVSALDGRLLSRTPLTFEAAHTYRVFANASAPFRAFDSPVGDVGLPHPTGLPDGFAPALASSTLVTLDHAGLSTGDPWLPVGATELKGNNAHAYADLSAPDGLDAGDVSIAPTAGAFDFAYDFDARADAGSSQHAASATQAFFVANQMHDVFYDLGFDEVSRNAQDSNLGRGGLGGDALRVEVHDFARRNNATMSVTSDGESPRMQLHLFDPNRASTLTVTSSAFADGGLFAGVPNVVERDTGWDVTGPLRAVMDEDGGFGGCDPWPTDAGDYTGAVVLVDGLGCGLARRINAALDAGAVGLVLNGACLATNQQNLIVTCLELDAGTRLREAVIAGGATFDARLVRPPATNEFDVAFDTTVVVHEYTHLVTTRLVGDGLGLLNTPARAMGEGWSDFVGVWMSLQASDPQRPGNDQWQGSFAIGGWSSQGHEFDGAVTPSQYYGVRRYPYSTSRSRNPLTFKHVALNVPLPDVAMAPRNPGDPNNAQVHNAGEVWASMLWDAQVALLNAPGAQFDAAHTAMGRYLVAALKATPALPTFIEARDALLAVVFAQSPTADFPRVLDAFAARGLGVLATSSDRRSTTNTPLAEDFTGQGGNFRLVSVTVDDTDDDCDADGVLDSLETGTLTVTLLNTGSRRLSQTQLRLSSTLSALTLPTAAQPLPASDPFTTVSLTVPVTLTTVAGIQRPVLTVAATDPGIVLLQNRFEATAELRLNTNLSDSSTEDFEQPVSDWKIDADGDFPFEDTWVLRQPSPMSPNRAMIGPNPRETGTSWLTSPPIAVGSAALSVTWAQSYSFESSTTFFDGGRLEVSTDGTTFTPVPGSALTPTYSGMLRAMTSNPLAGQEAFVGLNATRHDVTASFGTQYANRTVWLRFVIGADSSTGAPGWVVDDVRVTGATMPPFTQVIAHVPTSCTNHPPTVSGTSSVNIAEREPVVLIEGTAFDRDDDPLTVRWMQTSGPSVVLSGNQFLAPEVTPAGAVLGFRVTVDDGRGGTDTDDMTVTVRNVNRGPTILGTTGPQMATSGDSVTFEVQAEDPDGDALTFQWEQQGEATVTLTDVSRSTLTFTAPKVSIPELVSFRVVAIDGAKASDPAFIGIAIEPKAEGCQCTSAGSGLFFALAALVLRRRRVTASSQRPS